MRKTVAKKAAKQIISTVEKAKSPDDELTEHLTQAEHHLIEAIHLFGRTKKPVRDSMYLKRLEGAQTAVTGLLREELVRIRGPLKPPKIRKLTKLVR